MSERPSVGVPLCLRPIFAGSKNCKLPRGHEASCGYLRSDGWALDNREVSMSEQSYEDYDRMNREAVINAIRRGAELRKRVYRTLDYIEELALGPIDSSPRQALAAIKRSLITPVGQGSSDV